MSTSVENQLKAMLPTNNDTRTITYNEHFIISNNPLRRVAWEVSKVINLARYTKNSIMYPF